VGRRFEHGDHRTGMEEILTPGLQPAFLPFSREPVRQLTEDTESFLFRERGKRKEQKPEYEHEYEKESRDINSDAG